MVTKLSDLLQSRRDIKEPLVKNTLTFIETKQTYHKSATMPFNKQAVMALDENFQMKYFAFFHFNEVQAESSPKESLLCAQQDTVMDFINQIHLIN